MTDAVRIVVTTEETVISAEVREDFLTVTETADRTRTVVETVRQDRRVKAVRYARVKAEAVRSRVVREDHSRAETEDRITEAKDALVETTETTVADRDPAAEEETTTLYSHQN